MEWIQTASAFGFGALAIKILDIVWLQRAIRDSERKKWLREKRLEAYTELTKEILSLGQCRGSRENAFNGYALASEAILLVENEELAFRIEKFFTMITNLYMEALKEENDPSKKTENHLEGAYEIVVKESKNLVLELRKSLHKI